MPILEFFVYNYSVLIYVCFARAFTSLSVFCFEYRQQEGSRGGEKSIQYARPWGNPQGSGMSTNVLSSKSSCTLNTLYPHFCFSTLRREVERPTNPLQSVRVYPQRVDSSTHLTTLHKLTYRVCLWSVGARLRLVGLYFVCSKFSLLSLWFISVTFSIRALRALNGVVGWGFNHGGSGVCLALNVLVVVLEFFLRLFDQLLWDDVRGALGVVVAGVVHVVSLGWSGKAVHTAGVGCLQTAPGYRREDKSW